MLRLIAPFRAERYAENMRSSSVRVVRCTGQRSYVHTRLLDESFRGEDCCYTRDTEAEGHYRRSQAQESADLAVKDARYMVAV